VTDQEDLVDALARMAIELQTARETNKRLNRQVTRLQGQVHDLLEAESCGKLLRRHDNGWDAVYTYVHKELNDKVVQLEAELRALRAEQGRV